MTHSHPKKPNRWLSATLLVALILAALPIGVQASQGEPMSSTAVRLPPGADKAVVVDQPSPYAKNAYPNMESMLAQVYEATLAKDRDRLDTFRGNRYLDVEQGTARVILEMARDPEARQAGLPTAEIVTLPDGRQARIEHAPRIAIRQDLADALAAAGATFETAHGNLVQVSVALAALERLANLPDVAYVRLPYPVEPQALPARPAERPFVGPVAPQVGAVTSEGVGNDTLPLTNIYKWHASPYNYGGAGINLAVFDFGFTNWGTRRTSGDLPGGVVTKDFSSAFSFTANSNQGTAGYDHGTACAEIAYDMAPGATVYLYAFGTDVEFANAVDDYRNNVTGKRVATMSISWVNAGPYDGTGSASAPATKVNQARDSGIFWANSAGNYQTQHWSGTATQSGTGNYVAFGSGNINAFGPDPVAGTVWNIPSGTNIRIFLGWNDWNANRTGNQNRIDYDLRLVKWNGSSWSIVASSLGDQCGTTTTPVEAISFNTSSNTNPYYGVVIERYTTGSCPNNFGHWMQLYTFNGFYTAGTGAVNSFWYTNPCNSLAIPADADGAVAAGATFWGEDANATYNYGLETFSSFGPRNASGGANPGTTVNKPSVVAPDGVSTATYGASNNQAYRISTSTGFWGTSAAAPHVAGMAATVWQIYSSYTLAQLRGYIESQSLYKGSGGACGGTLLAASTAPQSATQNNRFGWGRIFISDPSPQAVTLAGFTAGATPDRVTLAWETVSEIDNAGFNLYRTGSAGVKPESVDMLAFVPAQAPGSTDGASYTYVDTDVAAGQTYWYWLEDVDVSGARTLHGPVSAMTSAPAAGKHLWLPLITR